MPPPLPVPAPVTPAPAVRVSAALAALTAALVLVPSAQAGLDAGGVWKATDGVMGCAFGDDYLHTPCFVEVGRNPCAKEAVGNACDLARSLGQWCRAAEACQVGDPTDDRDHDLVPDLAESNACGRSVLRQAVMSAGTDSTSCHTSDDMGGLPDEDRDGLPDTVEPTLCAVEDQNTPLDGSCDASGQDYTI